MTDRLTQQRRLIMSSTTEELSSMNTVVIGKWAQSYFMGTAGHHRQRPHPEPG